MTKQNEVPQYKKKDFMSDQIVRWCPGCGDYSILSQVQTAFSQMGIPREKFAVISGIGCSSRFPYYMNTYGFHTIHGRAPAFATGLKIANPDLSVWVITGDGDSLSIGGNHLVHALRRNIDINILLFNNRIYGLTKGQYSPTSEVGKRTKSTPMGSIDNPFNPISLALGAGATWIARSVDVFPSHLRDHVSAAGEHTGTSFLEIYQNCNIFNDGAFKSFTEKDVRDEQILYLEHGKPLIWGTETRRGLVRDGFGLKVANVDEVGEENVVVHDVSDRNLAWLLGQLEHPDFPVPVGVFYSVDKPTYNAGVYEQFDAAQAKLGKGELHRLILGGDTWKV